MVITRPGGKGPIGLHITDSGTGKCELLHSVGAGSPAEAAGATPGSLVVEIDGANVERMSHDQLIATLKASGEQLVLTVASSYNTAGAGAAGAAGAGAGASNGELPDYLPQRVEAGAIIASITPARTVPSMSKLGADDVPVRHYPTGIRLPPEGTLVERVPLRGPPIMGCPRYHHHQGSSLGSATSCFGYAADVQNSYMMTSHRCSLQSVQ